MNHIEIATAFKNELAARYNLPELRDAGMGHAKEKRTNVDIEANLLASCSVEPTGQLAGIINRLIVDVQVAFWKNGAVGGTLKYRYQHHSRGSNGSDQEFTIVLERKSYAASGDTYRYTGCLSTQLVYEHSQSVMNRKQI